MDDLSTCPQCGATWAPGAVWCNLCFYDPSKAAPREEVESAPPASEPVEGSADLAWACPVCGEENSFDSPLCSVCGTPFGRLFDEKPREVLTPDAAARLGLVPGLAMIKMGRGGEGILRMAIAVGALLCIGLFGTYGGGAARVIILTMYAGLLAFLVAESVVDSRRLAAGRPLQVQGRWLMWAFGALFIVTTVLVIAVPIGAAPSGGATTAPVVPV